MSKKKNEFGILIVNKDIYRAVTQIKADKMVFKSRGTNGIYAVIVFAKKQ